MTIGERISQALALAGKSQADLARFLGTKQSTITGWVKEGRVPSSDVVLPICEFAGISPTWLLTGEESGNLHLQQRLQHVPILGIIKAGIPILAEENFDGEVISDIAADYALRVSGDSMIFAGIHDCDVVLLKHADNARNGQIVAAVREEDGAAEATLKYFIRERGGVVLRGANPEFPDIPFSSQYRIIGVYVGLVRYDEPVLSDAMSLEIQSEQVTFQWLNLIEAAQAAGLDADDVKGIVSMIQKVKK